MTREPSVVAVIPARYASSRFPGKLLACIDGKAVIEHTFLNARKATLLSRCVVATDDERIRDVIVAAGGEAVMTAAEHRSGTDRISEVASQIDADIIINVQGDEPFIAPRTIDAVGRLLLEKPTAPMATAIFPLTDEASYTNRNVVKVVIDAEGFALYFSRAPIPHSKGGRLPGQGSVYRHLGLYGYRREFLLAFARWPRSPLEIAEDLEQLRALENGYRIATVVADELPLTIDTPRDLERLKERKCPSSSSSPAGSSPPSAKG